MLKMLPQSTCTHCVKFKLVSSVRYTRGLTELQCRLSLEETSVQMKPRFIGKKVKRRINFTVMNCKNLLQKIALLAESCGCKTESTFTLYGRSLSKVAAMAAEDFDMSVSSSQFKRYRGCVRVQGKNLSTTYSIGTFVFSFLWSDALLLSGKYCGAWRWVMQLVLPAGKWSGSSHFIIRRCRARLGGCQLMVMMWTKNQEKLILMCLNGEKKTPKCAAAGDRFPPFPASF